MGVGGRHGREGGNGRGKLPERGVGIDGNGGREGVGVVVGSGGPQEGGVGQRPGLHTQVVHAATRRNTITGEWSSHGVTKQQKDQSCYMTLFVVVWIDIPLLKPVSLGHLRISLVS